MTRNTQLQERKRGCIRGGSRKYTLDGANTFTLMKHKHKGHTNEWRHHDYYNVVMRLPPSQGRGGAMEAQFPGRRIIMGAQKSPNNFTNTLFSTVNS